MKLKEQPQVRRMRQNRLGVVFAILFVLAAATVDNLGNGRWAFVPVALAVAGAIVLWVACRMDSEDEVPR